MTLRYDFDIHRVFPDDLFADPKVAKLMDQTGVDGNARSNYVALFRDTRTAEALRGADEEVRAFFEASGFGYNVYDSGAPAGRYPAEDEAMHVDVITRLTENLSRFDLADSDSNGIDFAEFLDHVVSAEPLASDHQPAERERAGSHGTGAPRSGGWSRFLPGFAKLRWAAALGVIAYVLMFHGETLLNGSLNEIAADMAGISANFVTAPAN